MIRRRVRLVLAWTLLVAAISNIAVSGYALSNDVLWVIPINVCMALCGFICAAIAFNTAARP